MKGKEKISKRKKKNEQLKENQTKIFGINNKKFVRRKTLQRKNE